MKKTRKERRILRRAARCDAKKQAILKLIEQGVKPLSDLAKIQSMKFYGFKPGGVVNTSEIGHQGTLRSKEFIVNSGKVLNRSKIDCAMGLSLRSPKLTVYFIQSLINRVKQ